VLFDAFLFLFSLVGLFVVMWAAADGACSLSLCVCAVCCVLCAPQALAIGAEFVPRCVVMSLVAVASAPRDTLRLHCLEVVRRLCVAAPALAAGCGGVGLLADAAVPPPWLVPKRAGDPEADPSVGPVKKMTSDAANREKTPTCIA
jgi:hypothetical protein